MENKDLKQEEQCNDVSGSADVDVETINDPNSVNYNPHEDRC